MLYHTIIIKFSGSCILLLNMYRYNKNGNSKLIPIIMQREIVDFIYFF